MLKHLYGVASAGCVAALSVNAYALDTNNNSSHEVVYNYDELGRLISTTRKPNTTGCGELIAYNLDPVGNRSNLTETPVCANGGSGTVVSTLGDALSDEGFPLVFGISRSGDMSTAVTVNYSTINGSAVSPGDYTAVTSAAVFDVGISTIYVEIETADDTDFESDETLLIELTSVSTGTISNSQSTGTIVNDDEPPNTPPVAVNDVVGVNVLAQVSVDLTTNDSDPDGDPLNIIGVTQPANGYVAITGNSTVDIIGWTAGTSSFSYTIADGNGGQATGYVTLNVQGGGGFPF